MGNVAAAPVVRFAEIDSTNAEAMRRASAGEVGPLWIVADRQTAGRGRSGRSWASPGGNLAATLLFALPVGPDRAGELAIVLGLAVHRAISGFLPNAARDGLELKWPNDLMIGEAKLAGILVETSVRGSQIIACAGIGLNISAAPDISDPRPVAALADRLPRESCPAPEAVRHAIAVELTGLLGNWAPTDGFAAIRDAWLAAAHRDGTPISVNTGTERVKGRFRGLSREGALLLEDEAGTVRRFTFGDVAVATGGPAGTREN